LPTTAFPAYVPPNKSPRNSAVPPGLSRAQPRG
jgi:hypothetical protein